MDEQEKYFDSLGNEITKEQAEKIKKDQHDQKKLLIDKKISDKDKSLFDKTTINK